MQVSPSGKVSAMDFSGVNHVHPVGGLAITAAAAIATMVRRVQVPIVLLTVACFIPSAQRVVIAGADFNFVRLMVLVCLVRIAARGEFSGIRWNAIDTAMAIGAVAKVVCAPMLRGEASDLVSAVGLNFESVGAYMIVRATVRSIHDARLLVLWAAGLCVAAVPFFLIERMTGRNLFSIFGGIAEFTAIREGRLRCQGPFAHAILAGCHFVAWIPLWIALALSTERRSKWLGILGVVSGFLIVFFCASSTPLVALIFGCAVWLIYPVRGHLRLLWVCGIVLVLTLHFSMKHPVWHLISRIDLVGGSTGYHRYRLIEAAVDRLSEWWLFGTPSTYHWGTQLFDVTNQFILEGVRGGVWALLAMCAAFVFAFGSIGSDLRSIATRRRLTPSRTSTSAAILRNDELFVLAIGATLAAHCAIFLAVSYFGQTLLIWLFIIGIAGAHRQWSRVSRAESPVDARAERIGVPPSRPSLESRGRPSRDDRRRDVEPLPVLHSNPSEGVHSGTRTAFGSVGSADNCQGVS